MLPKKNFIYKYLFLLTITVAILAPLGFLYAADPPPAPAAPTYTPLAPLPEPPLGSGIIAPTDTGLTKFLKTFFWLAIVSAGVLAVLMITKGGILYMTSEAFNTKGEAKTQITMAIVGFLLAISSVLILTTINPELLNFKLLVRPLTFTLPPLPASGSLAGCTTYVNAPTTNCVWYDLGTFSTCQDAVSITAASERNNYKNGSDSDCSNAKPSGSNLKCCQYSTPQNGCSGAGRWAGKTQCQWSSAGSVGDNCAGSVELLAGLVQVSDTFCRNTKPGLTYECCAK